MPPGKEKARPTIHDVARRAGVSATTVSHVLNQTRFVADDTKKRVLAAMNDLGYHPDAAARSLRSRQRRIVGLLITNLENLSFAALFDGIDSVLAQAGYSVIVSATTGSPQKERECLRMFHEQRIDGLILAGSAGADEEYLHRLYATSLPMVYINRILPSLRIDHVVLDYPDAGRRLARHLFGLGHRRFALLGMALPGIAKHPFVTGWERALHDLGFILSSTAVYPGVSREDVGYQIAQQALTTTPRPTAVVAANTPVAVATLRACQEIGLAIPRDVSLATLGETTWNHVVTPPITAVPDTATAFGRIAAQYLIDRITGKYTGQPRQEIFPANLILRGSTAEAPSRVVTEPTSS